MLVGIRTERLKYKQYYSTSLEHTLPLLYLDDIFGLYIATIFHSSTACRWLYTSICYDSTMPSRLPCGCSQEIHSTSLIFLGKTHVFSRLVFVYVYIYIVCVCVLVFQVVPSSPKGSCCHGVTQIMGAAVVNKKPVRIRSGTAIQFRWYIMIYIYILYI